MCARKTDTMQLDGQCFRQLPTYHQVALYTLDQHAGPAP